MANGFDAMAIFYSECQSILLRVQDKGRISVKSTEVGRSHSSSRSSVFVRAWETFSQINQCSPTRRNNNITNRHTTVENQFVGARGSHVDYPLDTVQVLLRATILAKLKRCFHLVELVITLMTSLILICIVILNHKATHALVSRHTQDLIYPLMRTLRIVSLPVIRLVPRLSELYEEDCLIVNPNYFSKSACECWPCEESRQVIDMTGMSNFSSVYEHGGGIPFRIRLDNPVPATEFGFSLIEKIYLGNSNLFSSATLTSNVKHIQTFADVFPLNRTNVFKRHEDLHIAWKINKVIYARYLRKYFPKPFMIPSTTEISIQRFLFLDNFNSPQYQLPFTEFENVFLYQADGRRHIVLVPTGTCSKKCRMISVVLRHGEVCKEI